jgi:predicted RNase H-like nuclease
LRILGADLPQGAPAAGAPAPATLVLLDAAGRLARSERPASLLALPAAVSALAAGEPFLLGVNVPVVVPHAATRARPVESLLRRRLGARLAPGGRAAAGERGVAGEALLAGLAASGAACLPYPDREERRPGLAEIHPELVLKVLFWMASELREAPDPAVRQELFRALAAPAYRASQRRRARESWAHRAAALGTALAALDDAPGYDLDPARDALRRVSDAPALEDAAGLFDALLIAGTARRYLEAPETSLFLGDRESGYVILPADSFVRRVALRGRPEAADRLFPETSLRERLGRQARLRAVGLLPVPGRPQQTQAEFTEAPRYEFDNLDEMLWWKHCRHLTGPIIPTEGLQELVVALDGEATEELLRLRRSRHATLSFRFDPPEAWRARVPTRDGRTYPFRVLRAVYETLPADE